MNRRTFLLSLPALYPIEQNRRRFAVTMDDVRWDAIPAPFEGLVLPRLLEALGRTRAGLFVVGQNVANDEGRHILETWSGEGHFLGNHTYGHELLVRVGPDAFERSIARTEPLVAGYPTFRKWFRFPALKEGDARDDRDRLRAYLSRTGYRNAHVTVDGSDWYYDQRLRERLARDPSFPPERFREPYIAHVRDRFRFYDELARDVLGRDVPHTLLTHYNLLNGLFLKDVLAALADDGWERIDVEEAYEDPVFETSPDVLPAGESLVWSLAHASGRFESRLRYPGEDGEYEKPVLDRLGL